MIYHLKYFFYKVNKNKYIFMMLIVFILFKSPIIFIIFSLIDKMTRMRIQWITYSALDVINSMIYKYYIQKIKLCDLYLF